MHKFINKLVGKQHLSHQEIILSSATALIAIALVTWISNQFLSHSGAAYIVASMGASTVLLFAVPSSPMNRPWALLVSHIVSASIGVSCALYIPSQLIAIPLAVAGALLAMQYLRCLHPPGGATAMLIVLAPEVHLLGYQFVLTPVALNAVILLLAVRVLNFLLQLQQEKDKYESPTAWLEQQQTSISFKPPFETEDLQSALNGLDTFIDVKQEQLYQLYSLANHHHQQRRLGDLRCSDLMISNPVAAEYGTSLEEAWQWLGQYHISAIPVINRAQHVIGILTLDDFIEHARNFPQKILEDRIESLIRTTTELHTEKPEVVGQIMTHPVISAPDSSKVAELLPLLDSKKIHHMPIINEQQKLVGVLSRKQINMLLQGHTNSAAQ